jgi:hypothetical protein
MFGRAITRSALFFGLIAIALLAATGCAGDDQEPTDAPTDTAAPSQGIYDDLPFEYGEIIPAETDCELLQDIFDTAENAGDGRRDAGDLDGARAFTRVMTAADHRMEEVGCYD